MARKRRRLAQRRKDVGLSQERLAEVVRVDRSTVVRWERAETDPQPWHRPAIAGALKISIDELAELLADTTETSSASKASVYLAPGPAFGTEPGATSDLDALRWFRKVDRQVGGGHLYATVTGYLQRRIAPRLFGQVPDADEQSVFVAAAGLTEMAGWMAHDVGRDVLAMQHFQRALGLAKAGQDRQLGAHICGSMSHLAHHINRPDLALMHAEQGHDQLGDGSRHPGLEARLLAMQARGHAAGRRHDRCIDLLRSAERALAVKPTAVPSPWASTFDEASLAAEATRCLRRLDEHDAAQQQAERVISLRPPERARSRAFAQLTLISILIAKGVPAKACVVAREVLRSTQAVGSLLVVRQLEEIGRQLAKYHRDADVAAFLGCLQDELRGRQWLAQWLPQEPDQTRTGDP